ncbi:MAG: hypothetical protein ACRERR_13425 [Moraxellaceae bacterium]
MNWERQFELQGENAWFWLRQARRLKLAANLISKEFVNAWDESISNPEEFSKQEQESGILSVALDSFPVYVLLAGLAIENLAKGVLVAQDPKHFKKGARLTHDLLPYVEQSGISISPKQRDLLIEIEENVLWKGRYPVPKKPEDWQLRIGYRGVRQIPGAISCNDLQEIEDIYKKLEALIVSLIKTG